MKTGNGFFKRLIKQDESNIKVIKKIIITGMTKNVLKNGEQHGKYAAIHDWMNTIT